MNPIRYSNCWKDDSSGELMPTWTWTPDISVIKELAIQHLPRSHTDIEVEFFAEGAFNKLYTVRSPHILRHYLMRVTLPVEPFYKTESERATLAYIRKYTSVPVPSVIAYDSSSENSLGFEWLLLEKIDGIPLSEAWGNMDFDTKSRLSREMAHTVQQLSSLRFREIGNLYFSSVRDQVIDRILSSDAAESNDSIEASDKTVLDSGNKDNNYFETHRVVLSSDSTVTVDRGIGTEFIVGRIVSPWFFRDKRVLLPAHRGPFSSSYELMMQKVEIQIERIKNLSPLPTDEYFSETDEELAHHQDEVLTTCYHLLSLIPSYFPSFDRCKEINTLYHSDLSDRNIIVDPNTYNITGIVDWESVSICPSWETSDYPHFLKGIIIREPPPPEGPEVDEEALTEIRKDWEKVLLRRIYLKDLRDAGKGLNGIPLAHEILSDDDIKLKRVFTEFLYDMESRWGGTRHWMPQLRSKRIDQIDGLAMSFGL